MGSPGGRRCAAARCGGSTGRWLRGGETWRGAAAGGVVGGRGLETGPWAGDGVGEISLNYATVRRFDNARAMAVPRAILH